jgi:hypothetical protein
MNDIVYDIRIYGGYKGIPARKREFGRPRHRWSDNIKMKGIVYDIFGGYEGGYPKERGNLEDRDIDGVTVLKGNWIHVTQDGVQCRLL